MNISPLVAAAATLAPGLALAQGVEVSRVDLGQSGLALYELRADVEGDRLVFTVPEPDSDDVLGSLVVRDPAGGVLGLRTNTPDSAPEALRGTRFADGAPRDLPTLLAALVGSAVTLTTSEGAASGTVLGLGMRDVVVGETIVAMPTALLLNQGLVMEVVLEPGASVAIETDQSGVLAEASDLAFDADTTRRFELDLEASGAREVGLSYLTDAPAWKNSWRLLLGEGRLQGWATVENVSGQPWTGVSLTLSTGAPVAYARDLLSPRRMARLDPPDLLGERPKVRADEGFAESADAAFLTAPSPTAARARMGEMAEAPIAAPSAPAEAVRGIANVRYTVPYPVDLGSGRTANLLYIDLAVDAKVHALYQPGQSDDILLAARLTAEQALAPGLVSVRDETGFVGDAPFTGLDAGQVRLLPYAAAPQATVRQSRSERGASIDLVAAGGVLRFELREEVRSRYAAKVPDGVDVFVVEHPRSDARLVRSNGEVEENANFLRVSVPVTDGEAEATLLEQRVSVQRFALDGSGLRAIVDRVALGSAQISDEDRAVIETAGGIIQAIGEAESRLNDLQARYETLTREQERLRANLETVRDGALRERYEASMLATEDEIAATLDGMESARAAIREGEAALDETVRQML